MADAEDYLVKALGIFGDGSSAWREQENKALEALHWLYTEFWEDEPNRLADINRELQVLAAEMNSQVTSPASSSP